MQQRVFFDRLPCRRRQPSTAGEAVKDGWITLTGRIEPDIDNDDRTRQTPAGYAGVPRTALPHRMAGCGLYASDHPPEELERAAAHARSHLSPRPMTTPG